MHQDDIRELLTADPFEPFRIHVTSGAVYEVRDPQSVVLMKSRLFIAFPGGDKWLFIPYLHVSAVESLRNGRHPRTRGRGKR